MNDLEGLTLDGKYRLIRLLGKGGMGAVYLGQHVVIGKSVAVKFLHAEFAGNEEVIKRFYREAQAAAAIAHDNIIDVMDVGISPDGEPYLVMEFLEGESLNALLARTGPLDLAAACGIMEPVLLALHAAHAKGIVHRDLKPENIFLAHRTGEPPKIKLIDFGISKFSQSVGDKLTQTGSVMGTPAYMAPEQARGLSDLDHRADVYSTGVILYEMLTGKLPFKGDSFTELIISILTENPIPPREIKTDISHEIESILLQVLAKDPDKRFQTTLDFLEALKALADFDARSSHLTRVAASMTKTTYAAGNLGEILNSPSGTDIAAEVLSRVTSEATPTGWAGTKYKKKKQSRRLVIGLGVALAVLVAGVAGVAAIMWQYRSVPSEVVPASIAPVSPAPAEPTNLSPTVNILIKGAPPNARFFYDDLLVTQNPFKVQRGQTITQLKVVAEGFEPRTISFVPSEDRELEVRLTAQTPTPTDVKSKNPKRGKRRKKEKTKQSSGDRSSASTTPQPPSSPTGGAPPSPTVSPDTTQTKKKLVKGARGTRIQTDFE